MNLFFVYMQLFLSNPLIDGLIYVISVPFKIMQKCTSFLAGVGNIRQTIGLRLWSQVHRQENNGCSLIHLIHSKAVTWTDQKHKATPHPVPVRMHSSTAVCLSLASRWAGLQGQDGSRPFEHVGERSGQLEREEE